MKFLQLNLAVGLLAFLAATTHAATRYVDLNSPNPTSPYTDWSTAATNIQDAIDVADPGDLVLVTNGVYDVGQRVVDGEQPNRIAVTNVISLQSVNGPQVTFIVGENEGEEGQRIRCVYLSAGALLAGFTLTNGATVDMEVFDESAGGGVWGENLTATVSNCVIVGNSSVSGGGAYSVTIHNSYLLENTGWWGGGAKNCALFNCQVLTNRAYLGGGVNSCMLTDSSLAGNWAGYRGHYSYGQGGGAYASQLSGCSLVGNSSYNNGGGADASALNQCAVVQNTSRLGGGVESSSLVNSFIAGNTAAYWGGGAISSSLTNCTVTGNSAGWETGGVRDSILINSIVYYNVAPAYANHGGSSFSNSCTTPLPPGAGNIDQDPQLTDLVHLSAFSPCIGAGDPMQIHGVDIDGEQWANPPSMGCDEHHEGPFAGPLQTFVLISHKSVLEDSPVSLVGIVIGRSGSNVWEFGDGITVTNQSHVTHRWSATGAYPVVFTAYNETHPQGVSSTQWVQVLHSTRYVDASGTNPVPPYLSWDTAAITIQDAVDAAEPFCTIIVTNGVYRDGETIVLNLANRVAITKPITVQSVNGPAVTAIEGYQVPGTINDFGAIRCVYLSAGATLAGFTITNGATEPSWSPGSPGNVEGYGGGIYCGSSDVVVSNCIVVNSSAGDGGGGVSGGSLINCVLSGNSARVGGGIYTGQLINCLLTNNMASDSGGGAYSSILSNCWLIGNQANVAGGASDSVLDGCILTGNHAVIQGGAIGILNNCILTHNSADEASGGADGLLNGCLLAYNHSGGLAGAGGGTFNNCTITYNTAASEGGGVYESDLSNCIIYNNYAPKGSNHAYSALSYCWTVEPIFVDPAGGDFRLQSNSPCINAGNNAYILTGLDLDDNARISGDTVDIGAYEFQSPSSVLSYAWAQQFGLPTDGSADYADDDGDGMNNYGEWRSDTIPTNSASVLKVTGVTNGPSGAQISWQSVTNRNYWLERAGEFSGSPSFQSIAMNIPGVAGTKTYVDTSATNDGPYFYRVRVAE